MSPIKRTTNRVKESPVQEPGMITDDAREFGLHVKQGGWRLGLLVARNVFTGKRTDKINSAAAELGKLSTAQFAKQAGCSDDTVRRYFAAWERAADEGHVPHAAELEPGTEPDLDGEKLPSWSSFSSFSNDDDETAGPDWNEINVSDVPQDLQEEIMVKALADDSGCMSRVLRDHPGAAQKVVSWAALATQARVKAASREPVEHDPELQEQGPAARDRVARIKDQSSTGQPRVPPQSFTPRKEDPDWAAQQDRDWRLLEYRAGFNNIIRECKRLSKLGSELSDEGRVAVLEDHARAMKWLEAISEIVLGKTLDQEIAKFMMDGK